MLRIVDRPLSWLQRSRPAISFSLQYSQHWRINKLVCPFSLKCGIAVVRIAIPGSHRPLCCRLREAGRLGQAGEHESDTGTHHRTISLTRARLSRRPFGEFLHLRRSSGAFLFPAPLGPRS